MKSTIKEIIPILLIFAAIFSFFTACADESASSTPPEPSEFKVAFDANGGNPVPQNQTISRGNKVDEPTAISKTGYSLGGWYKEPSFFNKWNFSVDTVSDNMTLYAKWNANQSNTTYTVTFNINSDSGTPPNAQIIKQGSSVTLPDGSGFSRNGYTFNGWNTNASGTGISYSAGSAFTPNDDTILYVKWEINPPAEVRLFTATAGDAQVILNWTEPSDINFSNVEITYTPADASVITVLKGTTSTVITGLSNGTTYLFTIRTVNIADKKSDGVTASAKPEQDIIPDTTPPAEVTNLRVGGIEDNGLTTITWSEPLDPDFHHVEITYTQGNAPAVIALKGVTSVNVTITDLIAITYTFTVRTVDAVGNKSEGSQYNRAYAYPQLSGGSIWLSGTNKVGFTLSVNITGLQGSGEISYQWQRSRMDIAGATNPVYRVVYADRNNQISVVIKRSFNSGSVRSNDMTIVNYNLGQMGPGGGYIVYERNSYPSGFTNTLTGEVCHYLEASLIDPSMNSYGASFAWVSSDEYNPLIIQGATGTAIGTGAANTAAILAVDKSVSYITAAKACTEYVTSYEGYSYNDWFLPSEDELHQIYLTRASLGIQYSTYWSSTDLATSADIYGNGTFYSLVRIQNFANGGAKETATKRLQAYRAFAVRAF